MEERMGKKCCLIFVTIILFYPIIVLANTPPQSKIAVFNFRTVNLEASGYGTSVTNLLIDSLKEKSELIMIGRRELEAFLNLHDLQQDDNLANVLNIGTQLGIDVIVVGNVEKKGATIVVNCKVIHIKQKTTIFDTQLVSFGDTALGGEIKKLSTLISTAIANPPTKKVDEEKPIWGGPVNIKKRSGSSSIYLKWEDAPGTTAVSYEVFRSTSGSGPFTWISQVAQPEYLDRSLEKNATYYYQVRACASSGLRSNFSSVIPAETVPVPHPPVILRAEGHIKSVRLTWSPSPTGSEDPLGLKGYKLYRAKIEQGPYNDVANILGRDPGIGIDVTTTLDKLLKVTYVDRELADGEDYYYKLTAYNEKDLESEFSNSVKVTTTPVVSGLSAQGMIREVKLTGVSIDSPFIKGYYIYRNTVDSGNFTKIKKIDVSNIPGTLDTGMGKKVDYTDREGLGDNLSYYYRITAFEDEDRETSPSVAVSAVTKGKPPTPESLKAVSGLVKKVELTWTASSEEDVEGYNIYWSREKVGKYLLLERLKGRTTNKFTHASGGIEKLDDNTTYYYTIRSFNVVDLESDLSEVVFATTKARPTKPLGLKGEELKVKEAPLIWLANPENDIAVYHVWRAGSEGEEFTRIADTRGETTYIDRDLKDGCTYRYRIQAGDRDGLLSDFSETISIQTKPRPKSPEGLDGDLHKGRVVLNWKPGNEPDISHYNVYEKRFLGIEKIATVKNPSFNGEGLPKGKKKTYIVISVDKDGLESEHSEEVTIIGR
jgi:fibronectin type 3 domain-containing protein/TolB-like protein